MIRTCIRTMQQTNQFTTQRCLYVSVRVVRYRVIGAVDCFTTRVCIIQTIDAGAVADTTSTRPLLCSCNPQHVLHLSNLVFLLHFFLFLLIMFRVHSSSIFPAFFYSYSSCILVLFVLLFILRNLINPIISPNSPCTSLNCRPPYFTN